MYSALTERTQCGILWQVFNTHSVLFDKNVFAEMDKFYNITDLREYNREVELPYGFISDPSQPIVKQTDIDGKSALLVLG